MSRKLFFETVLPALEIERDRLSRNNQIRIIKDFFSKIGGCTVTPPRLLPDVESPPDVEAFIEAFIERMSVNERFFNEYFNLITFKLGLGHAVGHEDVGYIRKNIVGHERQDLFIANGGVSGSNYIEDLLDDLLDAIAMNPRMFPTILQYNNINECVNLLMCPLKVYFKLFIYFTRPRNPHTITDEMAIKYFKIFMDKSELIIIKKLRLIDFLLMQDKSFAFDDDIINVLTSRFIMCLEFFKSTEMRGGFSGDFYNTVLQEFDLSHDLRRDAVNALERLKRMIQSQEISDEDNERLDFFTERERDVDRMITDLDKLIPLINKLSELFHQNSERTSGVTVGDSALARERRRQEQPRDESGGGRKKQKKCKNIKKCKNTKKCKR